MNVSNLMSDVFSTLIVSEPYFLQPVLGHHPVLSSHLAFIIVHCTVMHNLLTFFPCLCAFLQKMLLQAQL